MKNVDISNKTSKQAKSLSQIFKLKKDTTKYVNHEFQIYGHYLATQLSANTKEIPIFIKFAKNEDRKILEKALEFVKGVYNPQNKVRLFLWKFKALKEEAKLKQENAKKTN